MTFSCGSVLCPDQPVTKYKSVILTYIYTLVQHFKLGRTQKANKYANSGTMVQGDSLECQVGHSCYAGPFELCSKEKKRMCCCNLKKCLLLKGITNFHKYSDQDIELINTNVITFTCNKHFIIHVMIIYTSGSQTFSAGPPYI